MHASKLTAQEQKTSCPQPAQEEQTPLSMIGHVEPQEPADGLACLESQSSPPSPPPDESVICLGSSGCAVLQELTDMDHSRSSGNERDSQSVRELAATTLQVSVSRYDMHEYPLTSTRSFATHTIRMLRPQMRPKLKPITLILVQTTPWRIITYGGSDHKRCLALFIRCFARKRLHKILVSRQGSVGELFATSCEARTSSTSTGLQQMVVMLTA